MEGKKIFYAKNRQLGVNFEREYKGENERT